MLPRKALPAGALDVQDLRRKVLTAHVFVEDIDERNQVQRWLMLGSPAYYEAPPSGRISIGPVDGGSRWAVTDRDAWLDEVRRAWTPGCIYVRAVFCGYSSTDLPSLPADPAKTPGFPDGRLIAPTSARPRSWAHAAQFDVGTLVLELGDAQSHVYRLESPTQDLYFEYWVLSALHEPTSSSSIEVSGAPFAEQYKTLGDFVGAMAHDVWGTKADTLALGTCYAVDSVDQIA